MPDSNQVIIAKLREELTQSRTEMARISQEFARTKDGYENTVRQLQTDLAATRERYAKADDALQKLRSEMEARIGGEVQAALKRAADKYDADAAAWRIERGALQAQLDELRTTAPRPVVTGKIAPTELAARFAEVLENIAAKPPDPEKSVTAALTEMRIEARGVLEASQNPKEEPKLVTLEAGATSIAHVSTVTMSFKAVPNIIIRSNSTD